MIHCRKCEHFRVHCDTKTPYCNEGIKINYHTSPTRPAFGVCDYFEATP